MAAATPKFSPELVKRMAREQGYLEIPPASEQDARCKLTFTHSSKSGCGGSEQEFGGVKIHVYFTTGNVRTEMDHPTRGRDPLHRQCKMASLVDLKCIFINPRIHTNAGYRRREKKPRVEEFILQTTEDVQAVERGKKEATLTKLMNSHKQLDDKHRTVVIAGSRKGARALGQLLGSQAAVIVGGTSKQRRSQKLEKFKNGNGMETIVVPNLEAITSLGVEPRSLGITHIVQASLLGGIRDYLGNIEVLGDRGLFTTLICPDDLVKWRLMRNIKIHLQEKKQNLPEFLRDY